METKAEKSVWSWKDCDWPIIWAWDWISIFEIWVRNLLIQNHIMIKNVKDTSINTENPSFICGNFYLTIKLEICWCNHLSKFNLLDITDTFNEWPGQLFLIYVIQVLSIPSNLWNMRWDLIKHSNRIMLILKFLLTQNLLETLILQPRERILSGCTNLVIIVDFESKNIHQIRDTASKTR